MERWALNLESKTKDLITNYLSIEIEHKNNLVICLLQEIIKHAPEILTNQESCINSLCYYLGGLLFSISYYPELENIYVHNTFNIVNYRCIKLTLACLLVDIAIDDHLEKEENLKGLKYMLSDILLNIKHTPKNLILSNIYKLVLDILEDVPSIITLLIQGLKIQIESTKQKNKNIDFDELCNIETNKAYITIKLYSFYIFNGVDIDIPIEFGTVVQFMDDICDYELDLESGIHTVLAKEIQINGNADRLFDLVFELTDNLPNKFWIFKILIVNTLILKINMLNINSPEYKHKASKYNLINSKGYEHDSLLFRKRIYDHMLYNLELI